MTECPGSKMPARVMSRNDDGTFQACCAVCEWEFTTAYTDPKIARHYRDPAMPDTIIFV